MTQLNTTLPPVRTPRAMLDRVTGRVTMYRLVVLALLALLLIALAVSLAGQIFYTPVQILAGGVVAVGATYLSSLAFAAVFRVRAHPSSSIITGLLLLFLFRPTTDLQELSTIALAAVIASASKYLLAIRRRHIFNPAAIGALVVSLLQLNFAAWWIATPWLLPFTAIAAFVVLYRTHRLTMGLTFIVLAAGLITYTGVSNGTPFGTALGLALTSYPIVFLAGFMLSEPLTLPPRRWQQLALAAVVAVLLWVPFSVGPFYTSPELALVVGNLLAFAVGQRRGIRLSYLGRTALTPTSWEFEFRPHRPLGFSAGQYMELTLPHTKADPRGLRRIFSISSAPGETEVVRFGLRVPEVSSSFKRAILELTPGEVVSATSIGGDFVLPRDASRPLLLVAGGIGITPFISHLSHLASTGQDRDVVLVYSSTRANEIAYLERLSGAEAAGVARVLLVSPTEPESLPSNFTWIGAGPLTGDMLLAAVPDARNRDAFVSGPPQLVHSLRAALRRAGVRRVKADYFSGY
jgi:glycine betaine catabolism B